MEWKKYIRTNVAEMIPWEEGMDINDVSISQADLEDGSPKLGDMIARNPRNHFDKWLVAADYFRDNFKEIQHRGIEE